MFKQILILGLLTVIGSGCSKSESNDEKKDSNKQSQAAERSYEFSLNGCNTTKHQFNGNSDYEVTRQLCEALQDDKLNRSCAESMRYDYFRYHCRGYTWSPKYAPKPEQPRHGTRWTDYAKRDKVSAALKNVLVDSYTVFSALKDDDKAAASRLGEDLISCGLSSTGPKCLNFINYALSSNNELQELDGKLFYFTEIQSRYDSAPLYFRFTIEATEPDVKVQQVEVLKVVNARSTELFPEYIKNQANFSPILTAAINTNFKQDAWKRLLKPRDIKELFHLSDTLIREDLADFQNVKKKISAVFEEQTQLISKSNLENYQERCLNLIFDYLKLSSKSITSLLESLLASENKNIKQIAASYLLNANPSKIQLKPIVLEALQHTRWDIRKLAVEALGKTNGLTKDEENKVLMSMNDHVESVRASATKVANSFKLNESNLFTLQELSKSQEWTTRVTASRLMGQIPGAKSTAALIAKMSDYVENVRKETIQQLHKRTLTVDDIELLATELKRTEWTTRVETAKLLGKIIDDKSTFALIKHMSDHVENVRTEIVKQLVSRQLSEASIDLLEVQSKSTEWTVRVNVAKLLGKTSYDQSIHILIKNMSDHVENVRTEIFSQLKKMNLSVKFVPSLATQLQSQEWTVRISAVKLLGKIKDPSAREALEAQIKREQVSNVKEEILKALKP